jgi:hypothetical protein
MIRQDVMLQSHVPEISLRWFAHGSAGSDKAGNVTAVRELLAHHRDWISVNWSHILDRRS